MEAPGLRWTSVATSANGLVDIAGHDFPAQSASKVHITRDGGATWAILSGSPVALWHDIAMSADASVVAMTGTVSAQSRLWVSTNSGTSFTQVRAEAGVIYGRLAMSDDGTKILVRSSTGVLLSTTSANSFTLATTAPATSTPENGGNPALEGDVAMTTDGQTMYAPPPTA